MWEIIIPSIILRYPIHFCFRVVNFILRVLKKFNILNYNNNAFSYYCHLQSWTNEEFLMLAHGLTGDIYVEIQAISFFENLQKEYLGM